MVKKPGVSFVIPALIFISIVSLFSLKTNAETQQETRCYSECAAYKFAWVGDVCFDTVQQNCSIGASDMVSKTISFVKDAYSLISKGELVMLIGVKDFFTAWFICKPLIEDCIVPQLNACKTTCDYDAYYYSPNISVGSPYSNYFRGVYYNDQKKELRFKAVNNGLGYAWNIGAQATWGSTPNRDGVVGGGGMLFDDTIPELLFLGSRQGSPPTLSSTVVDFLIDESNFSNFLSGFKSDAGQHYIPPVWEKVVHFSAPDGELTKVFFNVDYDGVISESNENDNNFVLEIDKRPAPATFEFKGVEVNLVNNSLNDFSVDVRVKNIGEETGTATLQWFDGEYKPGNVPFATLTNELAEDETRTFNYQLEVDNTNGLPSCHRTHKYSLLVTDPYGGRRTTYFEVPLYAGQISGKVTDLFGKNVKNASVTLSNGMQTTTNDYGNYGFKGITELGEYTVTVTHPDFTQAQTGQITMEFNPGSLLQSYCQIGGLDHKNVDFVIKDEPVLLTIRIKDRNGNSLVGTVTVACEHFNYNYEIPGEASFPDIQPEKCQFNVTSLGYISQSQTIVLTAPSQDVEFVLTKLLGRNFDTGLTVHEPQLLWEKELPDEEFLSDTTATKNGKLLVFYASNSHERYGKLYFINPANGSEISVTGVPYAVVAQGMVDIDSSYDGRTVGMIVNPGASNREERIVKLFNAAGQEYNSTTVSRTADPYMRVSPDGTYVYGAQLMNNSLYKYTKGEIMGTKDKRDHMLIPRSSELMFTKDNNVITKYKNGLEVISFNLQSVRAIGDIEAVSRVIDASHSENEVLVRTDKKLYYFAPTGNWVKDVQRDSRHVSAATSVGGDYVLVTKGNGGGEWLTLQVFNRSGVDVTPPFNYKDVQFVSANDDGMFYMSVRGEKLQYYKIGSYASEYNPGEETGPEQGSTLVSDIQVFNYDSKSFEDSPSVEWFGLGASFMYKATKRITFNTDFGTVTFSNGTIFTRWEGKPVVIYGQAQIHATRPIEMTILKLKLYDPVVFYDKLFQYYNHQLSDDEYVIAKNLHTTYKAETKNGNVKVSVDDGVVEISTNNRTVLVEEKHELVLNPEGQYQVRKKTIPFTFMVIGGFLLGLISYVEIKYKNSKLVQKTNGIVVLIIQKLLQLVKFILIKTGYLIKALLGRFVEQLRRLWTKKS